MHYNNLAILVSVMYANLRVSGDTSTSTRTFFPMVSL